MLEHFAFQRVCVYVCMCVCMCLSIEIVCKFVLKICSIHYLSTYV